MQVEGDTSAVMKATCGKQVKKSSYTGQLWVRPTQFFLWDVGWVATTIRQHCPALSYRNIRAVVCFYENRHELEVMRMDLSL
jgi:hypothetical protein